MTAGASATGVARPAHERAEVLGIKRVGRHHHLTLRAPEVAGAHRPGTFVAVSVGTAVGPGGEPQAGAQLARRALWILRARPSAYGATVELLVRERGIGTRWLAGLAPGAAVSLTGPLGRPFALPREPVTCTVVAHEEGVAAVQGLTERLKERGCAVHVLLGAEDEAGLFGALDLRRATRTLQVATVDGSVGMRGRLEDLLDAVVDQQRPDVVYAAGPPELLRTAATVAERHGAWSQVALTPAMPCGTGHCHGCLVPVVGEDAVSRVVRACVDGPVVRGDRVRWAALGGGS